MTEETGVVRQPGPNAIRLQASLEQLGQLIDTIVPRTHAPVVLAAAASVEEILERCLLAIMRSDLSKGRRDELFEGHAPLSSFSAKIELAYALEIIDAATRAELKKIKDLRNEFAHAKAMASLDDEPYRTMFQNVKKPEVGSVHVLQVFMACIGVISDDLERFLVSKGVTEDISKRNLGPKAA